MLSANWSEDMGTWKEISRYKSVYDYEKWKVLDRM